VPGGELPSLADLASLESLAASEHAENDREESGESLDEEPSES
jgi:hypothetical protein